MDVVRGNPTLFMRRDEVEAAWAWVEPILVGWQQSERGPRRYPAGTNGPTDATTLDRARRPHLARRSNAVNTLHPVLRDRDRSPHRTKPRHPAPHTCSRSARPATVARRAAGSPAPTWRTASPRPARPTRTALRGMVKPNIAIVSAYNDMLSAHKPFEALPAPAQAGRTRGRRHRPVRRRRARDVRRHHPGPRRHAAVAVQPRRHRDVHGDRVVARHVRRRAHARRVRQDRARNARSARWLSGTCRRSSCPAGPMASGLPNGEKAKVRQLYAEGKVGREELLDAEARRTTAAAPAPSSAPPTPTSC